MAKCAIFMSTLVLTVFLVIAAITLYLWASPRPRPRPPPSSPSVDQRGRYRPDYQYIERTDAFYKAHIEFRDREDAKAVCEIEGASLLPADNDKMQDHSFLTQFEQYRYLWVASNPRREYKNQEGKWKYPRTHIVCKALNHIGEIEEIECDGKLQFICKVDAKDAPYDQQCGVFANNYQYNAAVGSCYSVRRWAATWNDAYSECRSEGAHLVVLNSEAEKDVVHALIEAAPYVQGSSHHLYYFAGFRANKTIGNESSIYRTIFNESLAEAGFAVWSPGEPNNLYNQELCGSLIKSDGLLNDINCEQKYPFVCEKEVAAKN